ncbi:TIGR01244 family sulfur transferase [Ruegeria marina]|uniref:TIGR01244 family protein n=1 Tax=Ruegeria marina TaxID=639004 RepID=A0A1G6S245_9RHOB|nr:TIGR01244 family sulfur transferase [Ruegeria marina]SDD10970.1 TIGR01244 family protein [Ruegeria marina]
MDIRPITPRYAVSPQISVEDIPAIAEAGFTRIICNRPDAEVPPSHQAAAIGAAARAAGLEFETLELTHQTMTPENIARQMSLATCDSGPVLAYCASGTRSSVIWALGQCPSMTADEILSKTAAAGYALDALRPRLEELCTRAV